LSETEEKQMAKVAVKPKSKHLYDTLRDEGMKKKKAAKVANGYVATKRGDTSSSPKRRSPSNKSRSKSKRHSTKQNAKSKRG
jgi:hypothetical protein